MTALYKYPIGEYHSAQKVDPRAQREPWGAYYWANVLEGLPSLVEKYAGRIQLIYLDPPFMTGQLYKYRQSVGEKGFIEHIAYSDQWNNDKDHYLGFMNKVFEHAYELLTSDGSFYLHVDYRTSAYLRLILDEIFGANNFLNEIIWHYQSGGRAKKHFSRKHDNILFYRKSSNHYFNIDAVGEKRGTKKRNNMKREVDEDGRVFWSIKSAGKIYRYYEDSKVYPSDVWTDIPHLHQRNPERTGYDTQKPEALLERIILSSSRPGDYVADLFAGSGTTLSVASRLSRRWIGMDSSPHSMHICRKRILASQYKKDFIIYYGAGDRSPDKPKVLIERLLEYGGLDIVNGLEDKGAGLGLNDGPSKASTIIKLADYIPPDDGKSPTKKDSRLELHGLEYIDYWAIGYIEDGLFYPEKCMWREDPISAINDTIKVRGHTDKDLAVHLVDVFGNQFFEEIG